MTSSGTAWCASVGLWIPATGPRSPNWLPWCAIGWRREKRRYRPAERDRHSFIPVASTAGQPREHCLWPKSTISPFLFQLYHNTSDQTTSDYQNAATILDISALAKQDDNRTQSANDYRGIRSTEESKDAASDTEPAAADEKLVKPPDTEWPPNDQSNLSIRVCVF